MTTIPEQLRIFFETANVKCNDIDVLLDVIVEYITECITKSFDEINASERIDKETQEKQKENWSKRLSGV